MQSKDRAAIKRLIDHLILQQLVIKRKSKSDKRKKKVSLTQEGEDLVRELNEIARKTFSQSSKDLNEVELNAFKRLIRRINDKA
jgi:DNA-binding MarR family transcriptional regulator